MRRSVDDAAVRWRLFMAAAERAHSARHDEQTLRLGERALATAERVEPQSESLAAVARVRRFLAEVSEAVGDEVTATVHRGAAIDALRQLGDRRGVAELHLAIQAGRAEPPSLEALAEAEHLAAEIGWSEGVRRARALRLRLPSTAAP